MIDNNPNKDTHKDILWQKIRFFQTKILNPESWYTGIGIKKYFKKNLFSLKPDLQNPSLKSSQWSGYCHFCLGQSFTNLLQKQNLRPNKQILMHPLLPASLVETLKQEPCDLLTLDIQKDTLNWSTQDLEDFVSQNQTELVVFYVFNGLYREVAKMLTSLKARHIPAIVIVDNSDINWEFFEVLESLELGGLIWNAGQDFLSKNLNQTLANKLKPRTWYFSINLEKRSLSLLEYHLSDSQKGYQDLVKNYYYLLLKKYKKLDLKGKLYDFFINKIYLREEFKDKDSDKDPQEIEQLLKENYQQTNNLAVPDIFFDWQTSFTSDTSFVEFLKSSLDSPQRQEEAKKLYSFLAKEIKTRPNGSLEVPSLNLQRDYLVYFFLSTDQGYWQDYFEDQGYKIFEGLQVSSQFTNNPDLENTALIQEFLIGLKTS